MFNDAVSNSYYAALNCKITAQNKLESKIFWPNWSHYPATWQEGANEIVLNVGVETVSRSKFESGTLWIQSSCSTTPFLLLFKREADGNQILRHAG